MSLRDRLPSILPLLRDDSNIAVIIDAIQDEFDTLQNDTDTVQDSLFLPSASGQALDLIGEEFSLVGRRAGRSDEQYRQFLQGLVPVFSGRGTEKDVEISVAAGVADNPQQVDLLQDFQNLSYQIELLDWRPHESGTTRELAELADPPAVDLNEPVILFSDVVNIRFVLKGTRVGDEILLQTADIQVSEEDTRSQRAAAGFGSDDLEPISTVGFRISEKTI
jgi:hypothetical protein